MGAGLVLLLTACDASAGAPRGHSEPMRAPGESSSSEEAGTTPASSTDESAEDAEESAEEAEVAEVAEGAEGAGGAGEAADPETEPESEPEPTAQRDHGRTRS